MLEAGDRARRRADEAAEATEAAEHDRAEASRERDRLLAVSKGVRRMRALGALDESWIAYAPSSRALRDRVRAMSAQGPVALVGELGVGVVAVARMIHDKGQRAAGPFVVFDGGRARAEDVLPALLGDARSAPERAGWLEHAAGGTLVVEDLPALGHDAQVSLLDAVRAGTARRYGAEGAYAVDVRVVFTMRAAPDGYDLPRALLEMLAHHTLRVPPLRERVEDLESLTLMAVDRACRIHGRAPVGLAPEAMLALRGHPWPGNLDELFAVIDQAVLRTRGPRVTLDALPPHIKALVSEARSDEHADDERTWRGDA
jgi:DNA-binding NtrC family response regulator